MPGPKVYEKVIRYFFVLPQNVSFQSSDGWDVAGAATFGFSVVWVNRFSHLREQSPDQLDIETDFLEHLPSIVGVK